MQTVFRPFMRSEMQELADFLGATAAQYPQYSAACLAETYRIAVDATEEIEELHSCGINMWTQELSILAMLMVRHIHGLWVGSYTLPRTAWYGRMSKSTSSILNESLNLIFEAPAYSGAEKEEIAALEMVRLATTRNGPLTLACMYAMPVLREVVPNSLQAQAALQYMEAIDEILAHWYSMCTQISAEAYAELDESDNNIGPLYTHMSNSKNHDWTLEVLAGFEVVFEEIMEEIEELAERAEEHEEMFSVAAQSSDDLDSESEDEDEETPLAVQ